MLAHLAKKGFSVSLPFGNNQRYDMIVDDGQRLMKAQVKTGRLRSGVVMFHSCSTNGFTGSHAGYKGQADIFLVYCQEIDKVFMVPVDKVGTTVVSLRIDPPRCSQQRRINWAKDFEI